MEIIKTKLGIFLIKKNIHHDERGFFSEIYNQDESFFNINKLEFKQDNFSFSKYGVLRGLHFQKKSKAQGKLIQVLKGEAFDVVVNIDKDSKNFKKHEFFYLTKNTQIYIPPNFAHGFLSLSDETILLYKCTETYSKEHENTIAWNNPEININWPIKKPIISEKDLKNGINLSSL